MVLNSWICKFWPVLVFSCRATLILGLGWWCPFKPEVCFWFTGTRPYRPADRFMRMLNYQWIKETGWEQLGAEILLKQPHPGWIEWPMNWTFCFLQGQAEACQRSPSALAYREMRWHSRGPPSLALLRTFETSLELDCLSFWPTLSSITSHINCYTITRWWFQVSGLRAFHATPAFSIY